MNRKPISFEIKALGEDGSFEGLASVYGNVDSWKDIVASGSFTRTIQQNNEVPLLWQHNPAEPIGLGMLRDSADGLIIEGKLNLDVARAREAYSLLKQGAVKGLSIGFDALQWRWDGEVRILEEIRLWEVSVVTFPANELAVVTRIKSTGYHQLPVVDAPWDATEAEQRVLAWAGDDVEKKASAYLARDGEQFSVLLCDVVDEKLVLNKTAVQQANEMLRKDTKQYPDEVKTSLDRYNKDAGIEAPNFKRTLSLERVSRKAVSAVYSLLGEVRLGKELTAEERKSVEAVAKAVEDLFAAAPVAAPNAAAPVAPAAAVIEEPPKVEEPVVEEPSDSDQELHSLLAEMKSFATNFRR